VGCFVGYLVGSLVGKGVGAYREWGGGGLLDVVGSKEAHGVHLVLVLDLESIGLRSPKQFGLPIGLGLPDPKQVGLLLGFGLPSKKKSDFPLDSDSRVQSKSDPSLDSGLPGPKQIGLLLGLGLPAPRPDRTPPWTRAPGLLALWVWRAGSATSQPAFGLGKSNLPHGAKKQGT
jgi:hypothetical protein